MKAQIPGNFWDRYPPECRPLAPPTSLGNAGGLSGASLFRYDAHRGDLVARRWPEGTPADRVATIHERLSLAGGLEFVARPIPDARGRTWQEIGSGLWELGPWMPGSADAGPPTIARLTSAMTGLASFHRAVGGNPSLAPPPGLIARRDEIATLRSGGFDRLRDHVRPSPPSMARELASCWIDRASAFAPIVADELTGPCSIRVPILWLLRDARPEHFLFSGDRLTGLIDFGAMGFDPAAADLSRSLADWPGIDDFLRSEAIGAYERVRPPEAVERSLIAWYSRSAAILGGARWVRWHFVEGRRFDDPGAATAGLRRSLDRLERAFRGPLL